MAKERKLLSVRQYGHACERLAETSGSGCEYRIMNIEQRMSKECSFFLAGWS